ncbi:MAG: hypothetical protein ACR2OE_16550 [Thermomicrobiales bacterium]
MMDLPGNSAPDLYFVVVDQEVASRRTKPDSSEVLGTSGDVRGAVDVAMSKLDGLGQKRFGMKLAIVGLSRSDPNVWIDGGLVFPGETIVI